MGSILAAQLGLFWQEPSRTVLVSSGLLVPAAAEAAGGRDAWEHGLGFRKAWIGAAVRIPFTPRGQLRWRVDGEDGGAGRGEGKRHNLNIRRQDDPKCTFSKHRQLTGFIPAASPPVPARRRAFVHSPCVRSLGTGQNASAIAPQGPSGDGMGSAVHHRATGTCMT